jgi:uncharacterized membrane protein YccC
MGHDARCWSRVVAWLLAGLTAGVLVAVLVLLALNATRVGAPELVADAILAAAVGVGAAFGLLIISRRPGTPSAGCWA